MQPTLPGTLWHASPRWWLPPASYEDSHTPCCSLLVVQAHIELNAFDLAWDTVARFSCLRLLPAFYEDSHL